LSLVFTSFPPLFFLPGGFFFFQPRSDSWLAYNPLSNFFLRGFFSALFFSRVSDLLT